MAYRFSSLWVIPDAVKGADDALQADKAAATKQAADRQRQQAEAERLSSLRAADEAAKLDARQAASREQYGPTAKAAAARVAQDVREFTAQPQAGEQEKVAARLRSGSGNLHRCGEWSFCLTAARVAADQETR